MNLSERNKHRKVTITSIVFLQGEDYLQYKQDNPSNDIDYLLQWYDGVDNHYEQDDYSVMDINTPFLGYLIKIDGYKGYFLFSKDTHMGYMGLARLVEIL